MIAAGRSIVVIFLVLSSTGLLPTVARLSHQSCSDCADDCADADVARSGSAEEECGDCSPHCAVCICCPLRATPTVRVVMAEPLQLDPGRVAIGESGRLLAAITAEIFHPPRV